MSNPFRFCPDCPFSGRTEAVDCPDCGAAFFPSGQEGSA